MDNRNLYNNLTQPGGYYPYYPAAAAPLMRSEASTYMLPQTAPSAVLKGRPVSSQEEARVAQIDLDGSVSIFPDLGNKKIYTKRINADGTAALNVYSLVEQPIEIESSDFATKSDLLELKKNLEEVLAKLVPTQETNPKAKLSQPLNF